MVASFSDVNWQTVLSRVVTPDGYVRWERFDDPKSAARSSLLRYVALLAVVSPDNRPDLFEVASDRTTYWINAYNAVCMYGELLRHEATPTAELYSVDRFQIGNRGMTLSQIENDRLNPKVDPRVLFALNRCTRSSPPLRSEVYITSKINAQLNDQTVRCLSDARFVVLDQNSAKLNQELIVAHRQDFLDAYQRKNNADGSLVQSLQMLAGKRTILGATFGWSSLEYDGTLNRPPAGPNR